MQHDALIISRFWGLHLTGPPRDDRLFWGRPLLYVGSMGHVSPSFRPILAAWAAWSLPVGQNSG